MSPKMVMPLLLTSITSCVIAFGDPGTAEAQVQLVQFQPQGQQGDDQKKKPRDEQRGQQPQRGGQQDQQRGGGRSEQRGGPNQRAQQPQEPRGGGRSEQRGGPNQRAQQPQDPRGGQQQRGVGSGQFQRTQPEPGQKPRFGQQQEQRGQTQDRGRQEFEPRKVQEQGRPKPQPDQKKVQEQDRRQPGQPQGGRFGQGTPQGTPGSRKPQEQGRPKPQPDQPQGGRFGQGTPQGTPGSRKPQEQGRPKPQPDQPQGGRFGQGAPGSSKPQGQGPAGKGPAGSGAGGPQFGGGRPPAGVPQFGGRPQFGKPASPEEQRARAERDTRRIELGRKIREDQRRQADRERTREGIDERMRLQTERFRDIHAKRQERFDPNGVRFIEEPGNRKIFRLNNQTFIRHDETANFSRFGGRADRRPIPGGGEFATFHRPDGSRVEVEADRFGRPIRRVRVMPDGRRFTLFENRALAAGLGLAAIGAAIVLLPPPDVAMPEEDYIVDAGVASEETIYDTLYAPPVGPLPRTYSLDEVLASPDLRDRMRSVRLNTIHFEFGSWEVRPDQAPLLEGIADSVNRIVQDNPGEVFLIEGHTDAVGTDEDNLSLSDRRAEAVADVLTQYYQVPRENLVTQGYGEQFLLVPTQGPEIRNRRVVIRRLTPLLQGDEGRYSNSGQGPQNDYRP